MIGIMGDESLHSRVFMQRLSAGDRRAFEQIFRACYGRVYAVAYRLLGEGSAAEEVAQEAFIRLYRRPPVGSASPNLVGWLVTVATNLCYNRLRTDRRRRSREARAAALEAPSADTGDVAVRNDAVERVRRVLGELPERQALILLLRHSGLSYAEIAHQLEVAPGSVGTLLARAERAFRESYEKLESGGSHAEHS